MGLLEASQKRKRLRIQQLLKVAKTQEGMDIKHLIGLMSVNMGLKADTTKTYLKELSDAGFLKIDGGCIYAKKREVTSKKGRRKDHE